MKVIKTIAEMQKYRKGLSGKVGFVPTMGYLHEGHLSLVQAACRDCEHVIVSIFVNPTQFAPNEDLDAYPRDFEMDEELLSKEKVDCIFYPGVEEMYPGDELTAVEVSGITKKLEGVTRPTHFKGVTTVVAKLFNIVCPDEAYFGQKDLQQSVVIKRMVKDLNMDVSISVCPIVREEDGLALSSRNTYLSEIERSAAPALYAGLMKGKEIFESGESNVERIKLAVLDIINDKVSDDIGKVDYVEIVDIESLDPVEKVSKGDAIVIACFVGKTRLIDNVIL